MGIERAKVDLYTDGSCFMNGAGGWAYRLITVRGDKYVIKDSQGEIVGGATTSQRAEMVAIIAGLQALKAKCDVRVFTDSKSLVMTWQRLRDYRMAGRAIADEDLWKAIEASSRNHIVRWHHVKAHSKNPNRHNESCDVRARQMAERVKERMRDA